MYSTRSSEDSRAASTDPQLEIWHADCRKSWHENRIHPGKLHAQVNPVCPRHRLAEPCFEQFRAGLPSGVETVLSEFGDSAGSAGPVHQILSGSFNYTAGETFFLTSVFGVATTGNSAADFANTATCRISMNDGVSTSSGAGYMTAAVPEPETWAMLLVGLSLVGMQATRQRLAVKNLA